MRSNIVVTVPACFVALILAAPTAAHHSAFAFDTENILTVEGTVTRWFWANPHCLLEFEVMNDNGEVVHWVTETQAPANMIDAGWRKNNPVGRIVRVEFPDGRILDVTQDRSGALGSEYHLSGAPTD